MKANLKVGTKGKPACNLMIKMLIQNLKLSNLDQGQAAPITVAKTPLSKRAARNQAGRIQKLATKMWRKTQHQMTRANQKSTRAIFHRSSFQI